MNNLKHPIFGAPQYLEVQVPQTTDGKTLAYDDNRQPIFKKKYLPLSAKKRLEQKNTRLPEYLRLKITVKTNQPSESISAPVDINTPEPAPKNKGGRPKTQSHE